MDIYESGGHPITLTILTQTAQPVGELLARLLLERVRDER